MIRHFAAAALLAGALNACSSAGLAPTIAATATPLVAPQYLANIQAACAKGMPVADLVFNRAMPKGVLEVGTFVRAYCGQLLAGSVPATTDGNTLNWLNENLAALRGAIPFNL